MKKKFVWIIGTLLIVIGLNFACIKPSQLNKFPVPLTAQVEKTSDDNSILYEWNGINRLYHFQVQLAGWRKVDQFGSDIVYKKGKNRVHLLTSRGSFHIYRDN